jgi:DNA primase large subunit
MRAAAAAVVVVVVTHIMADVPTPEFQKLWSNLIESLMLEHENATEQYPDAVMEHVHDVLTAIAHLEGCTPVSVGESLK